MAISLQKHKNPLEDEALLAHSKKQYSNPISKATFQALPKIYGLSKKKKYLTKYQFEPKQKQQKINKQQPNNKNLTNQQQDTVNKTTQTRPQKIDSFQQRFKTQLKSYEKKSREQLSQPKRQFCKRRYCFCNREHNRQIVQSVQKINQKKKNHRAISIRLPQIDRSIELDDGQSRHKVALATIQGKERESTTERSPFTLLDLLKSSQRRFNTDGRYSQQRHKQQSWRKQQSQHAKIIKTKQVQVQFPIKSNNISVQTQINQDDHQENTHLVRGKTQPLDGVAKSDSERKAISSSANRADYTNKQQEQQVDIKRQLFPESQLALSKQRMNLQQLKAKQSQMDVIDSQSEESRSIKSSISSASLSKYVFESNKKTNTMFHSLKNKQTSSAKSERIKHNQNKESKPTKFMYLKKNGLFVIPEEDQYVPYLKSYQPLNDKFSIKKLVRKPNFKVYPSEEGVYFGQLNGEIKEGKGIMVTQKAIFEGSYRNNLKTYGSERNIDGVYKGQFINGIRQGYGSFEWNNGQIFQGQWKNGTKNGYGIWKSPKGDYYQGGWQLNRQHGNGIYKHKISTYRGSFIQFLKEGQGQQIFTNGDKYIGSYKQGKPDGKGRYQWADGSYYEGYFANGVRQGKGKWVYSNGTVYEGQFKNDFKDGYGKQTYKSGEYFEGTFNMGTKNQGTLFDLNRRQIKITRSDL